MKNKKISVNILTNRKSQMTLFMILGIIILFAFGFLYFSISSTTKSRVRTQVVQQVENILEQRSTKYYAHICIKDILKEGLVLLGKQGGYILPGQPGALIPQGYIQLNYANHIPYLIRPSLFTSPQYPCYTSQNPPVYCGFINNITLFPQLYSMTYGTNLLPYLQKYQGRYSIQEQLESYIAAKAPECMPALSEVPEFSNYGFRAGDIATEIEFTSSTVNVKLDYPVIISVPNIDPVSTTLNLQATVSLRFKQLYDAVKDIIQYDNNYLDYNILDDTYSGSFQGRQLKFSILNNVSFTAQFGLGEDVFVLNDTSSDIEIRPFVFQFVRKNRYPALDYIPPGPPKSIFEFVLYANDTLKIEPKAFDPDEDPLTYSYHGWKADYDSVWDDATRTQKPASAQVNYWENSPLFQQTAKSAEITMTPSDKGIHNFTVNVSDDSSPKLTDYQVIRVLVDRFLEAEGEGDNLYEDINNSKASIEDPYLLNVTSETILVDPTTRYVYTWRDMFAPYNAPPLHKGNLSCILLPITTRECFTSLPSIDNMIGPFSTISTAPERLGLTIEAFGINNQTASTTFNVTVSECLPHRNPNSPPYPFHNNTEDPFQADHTCCSGDGTVRTGEECMRLVEYTCYIPGKPTGLAAKAVQEAAGYPPTLWPATIIPDITAPRADSIFRRTFTQLCGKRGNACSGEITDRWVLYKQCNVNASRDIKEHCQGPARTKDCEINQANPDCYNYGPGESFEKTFLESPAATGVCNTKRTCSPAIAYRSPENNYGKGGPLNCQAQCSQGDGTCTAAGNCLCSRDCDINVPPNCDNKPPSYSTNDVLELDDLIDFWSGTKNEHGCTFNCEWVDCEPYVFNPTTGQCNTRADSQADCDDGFTYDRATSTCHKNI